MVMTLRKRAAPPPPRSPSTSPEKDRRPPTRRNQPNKRPKQNLYDSDLDSDSDSGEEEENGYEKLREQRIKENRERMQKLGILSLSSSLFSSTANNKKRVHLHPPTKFKPKRNPLPRNPHYRRSDRLKSVSIGNYAETEDSLKSMGISLPKDWTSEVYTDEDLKLLGDCKADWTLNDDGFDEDGERLYDPVNGTSCHQCRQKTLSKHTFCGKCRLPQGQICGDCLYMRYGENVLEASENSCWSCPVCRGICNCSRCRRAKGWLPANISYEKVIELGYKSVAHYLLNVRRAGATPKESEGTDMADLAEVKMRYEDSDTSAQSSESDSYDSDDDSKVKKRNDIQSDVADVPIVVCESDTSAQSSESDSDDDSKVKKRSDMQSDVADVPVVCESDNSHDDSKTVKRSQSDGADGADVPVVCESDNSHDDSKAVKRSQSDGADVPVVCESDNSHDDSNAVKRSDI